MANRRRKVGDLTRLVWQQYTIDKADNRMASIKANQVNDRRTSIREMSERAQQEIYQYLPIYSQPSERIMSDLDFKIRKFSQKSLHINNYNPETKAARKLPPMLRYQSQKYLKQQEQKRQEEEELLRKKKMSIHTLALKEAEPLSIKSPPLPRIRKSQPHIRSQKDSEIQWITPQEFMSMKLQLNKKKATKVMRENQQLLSQRKHSKMNNIINKHELISGWHTQEDREPDLYQ